MLHKTVTISLFFLTLFTAPVTAQAIYIEKFDGAWHLRALDGMEVRKARAILDFDATKMRLEGFDGCNRITGKLTKNHEGKLTANLISTRMACREPIHTYVSQRLHTTIAEGFTIQEEKVYGIEGITIKSASHELFLKKMGED